MQKSEAAISYGAVTVFGEPMLKSLSKWHEDSGKLQGFQLLLVDAKTQFVVAGTSVNDRHAMFKTFQNHCAGDSSAQLREVEPQDYFVARGPMWVTVAGKKKSSFVER